MCSLLCAFLTGEVGAQTIEWIFAGPSEQVTRSLVALEDGTLLLSGEDDLYRSTDDGMSWQIIDPRAFLGMVAGPGGYVLAHGLDDVYLSDDRGTSWSQVASSGNWVSGVAIGADSSTYFSSNTRTDCRISTGCITYGGGLDASDDFGRTWRQVAFDDTTTAIFGASQDVGIAGATFRHLVRSLDGGATWDRLPIPADFVVYYHYGVLGNGRVWISARNRLYTVDARWEALELRHTFEAEISRMLVGSHGKFFVLTDSGEQRVTLHMTDDDGYTWTSSELPADNCRCGMALTNGGFLMVGTGNGVYRSLTPVMIAVDSESSGRAAVRIAPNPLPRSSNGRLLFTLAAPARVSIEVYDLLGRRVGVVDDALRSAGAHEVGLDAAHLSAGVYMCRLTIGGRSESHPIVIVN